MFDSRQISNNSWFLTTTTEFRTLPDAVTFLEEKGSEFCSGKYAQLGIRIIPPHHILKRIEEYDGYETLNVRCKFYLRPECTMKSTLKEIWGLLQQADPHADQKLSKYAKGWVKKLDEEEDDDYDD